MFDFQLDDESRMVRVAVSGFWDAKEAADFTAAYQRLAVQARERWHVARILVDARESPVQSGDITKAYEGLNRAAQMGPLDRVAVVVGSSLVKVQAKRVLDANAGFDVATIFQSIEDAESWLREGG